MNFHKICTFYVLVTIIMAISLDALSVGDPTNKNKFATDAVMFNIACKCFADEQHITLIGIWSAEVLQQSQFSCRPLSISFVGINDSDMKEFDTRPRSKLYKLDNYTEVLKPYPSNLFLIDEVELSQLPTFLLKLKNSIWWNQYGNYLVKFTKHRNNCMYAKSYLKVFWNFELLNAAFLCKTSGHEIQYYTFNPFSDSVPDGWIQTDTFKQKNNHPFRIFKLQNDSFCKICEALKFDKSLSLGGYPVRFAAHSSPSIMYDKKSSELRGVEPLVTQFMWTKLNATISMKWLPSPHTGSIYSNGTVDGTVRDVLIGKYDVLINIRYGDELWKYLWIVYKQTDLCFVTQKKPLTVYQRFYKLMTWKLMMFFIPFHCIITIALMNLSKYEYSEAFLDVLRALFGASTVRQPFDPQNKIIFLVIIISIGFIAIFINSELCSSIAAPLYEPLIESMQDFIDKNYTLYAAFTLENVLYKTDFFNGTNLYVTDINSCISSMEQTDNSACLLYCNVMKFNVMENDRIHVAEFKKYHKTYFTILHRDNFSLRERWLNISQASAEGGLIEFHGEIWRSKHRIQKMTSAVFTSISQEQISITYLVWIYGLMFSSFVFVLEYFFKIIINVCRKCQFFK